MRGRRSGSKPNLYMSSSECVNGWSKPSKEMKKCFSTEKYLLWAVMSDVEGKRGS